MLFLHPHDIHLLGFGPAFHSVKTVLGLDTVSYWLRHPSRLSIFCRLLDKTCSCGHSLSYQVRWRQWKAPNQCLSSFLSSGSPGELVETRDSGLGGLPHGDWEFAFLSSSHMVLSRAALNDSSSLIKLRANFPPMSWKSMGRRSRTGTLMSEPRLFCPHAAICGMEFPLPKWLLELQPSRPHSNQ